MGFADSDVQRVLRLPNYDINKAFDKQIIDTIATLNDNLLGLGYIKPTTMFAIMKSKKYGETECKYYANLSPEFSVRHCE